MTRPGVVIVGGGFGGLACARALDGEPMDVLLIDAHNFHLFTPLLYQVATALLNPSDIAYPFRARFRRSPNVRFLLARVASMDLEDKRIRTADGEDIAYDHLVLATGSTNTYFGHDELRDATIPMKTIEDALQLRNHVLACLERASRTDDAAERRRWMTFVIAGGGPTGVEYAGALGELLKLVLGRDYPNLAPGSARLVLIEGQDRLLGAFAPRLGRYAQRVLTGRGVEVRTGVLLQRATAEVAELSNGERIDTRTIVWAAGVQSVAPAATPDVPVTRSRRIEVDEAFRIPGADGAYAIGDVAAARDPSAAPNGELPMLSPPAMQAGRYVAREILAETTGDRHRQGPFRYVDKGTMATIGRNAAVGQIKGIQLTGFIGWVGWLVVHIYYLIGFRNRVAVLASWAWNYLRRDRPIRIVARSRPDPVADELDQAARR
jgi:NADH dehydrogenase